MPFEQDWLLADGRQIRQSDERPLGFRADVDQDARRVRSQPLPRLLDRDICNRASIGGNRWHAQSPFLRDDHRRPIKRSGIAERYMQSIAGLQRLERNPDLTAWLSRSYLPGRTRIHRAYTTKPSFDVCYSQVAIGPCQSQASFSHRPVSVTGQLQCAADERR